MKLGIRYGLIRIEVVYYLMYNADLCDLCRYVHVANFIQHYLGKLQLNVELRLCLC